jgi:hypothetical protein
MAELGNLTGRILLSLRRMSTVKIRAGSLFRTPWSRIGAGEAGEQWSVVSDQWSGKTFGPLRLALPFLPGSGLLTTDH